MKSVRAFGYSMISICAWADVHLRIMIVSELYSGHHKTCLGVF